MGTPSAQTPAVPTMPTATSSLQEYINLSPQLFETEQKYQPQYAALAKQIQEQLYPQTTALTENLAGQATQGMSANMPAEYQKMYSDQYKGLLGENVKSSIGADAYSTGMLGQQKQWQDYYRDLSLNLSGRQPMVQGQSLTSGMNPQSIMGMNSSNYSTAANLYGTQSQNYWNQMNYSPAWQNMLSGLGGSALGGLGSMGSMGMYGYMMKQQDAKPNRI